MNSPEIPPFVVTEQLALATRHVGPHQLTRRFRFSLFMYGVFLPAILLCMSLSGASPLGQEPWQSGNLEDYVAMLLTPKAWSPFAIGIVYSAVSMGTWTVNPAMGRAIWIRIGIYTGFILSLHFFIVLSVVLNISILICAAIVLPCWAVTLWLLNYYWRIQFSIWHIMVLMTLVAGVSLAATLIGRELLMLPFTGFFAILLATPLLNVIAYGSGIYYLFRWDTEATKPSRALVLSVIAWFIGWAVAWKFAIQIMLEEYAKLPTENPNCYLSSAAAYAHPRLTGAARRGDRTMAMCRFKFLEIALRAATPALHRAIRRLYDVWCPPLARCCRRYHWLATLTCVCLWPIELLAEMLRWVLKIKREQLAAIYGLSSRR